MVRNVILVLLDTLRRDFVGAYGNTWIKTPNIDRLARRSVVFDNAYVGSYLCMPARRDLLTGKYEFPWRGWGPLEHTDLDLGTIVKESGKVSYLISDHYHLWERGAGNYHFGFSGFEFIRGQENDCWITDPTIPIDYPAPREKLCGHSHREGAFERYARNTYGRKAEEDYFSPKVMSTAVDWLKHNYTHESFFLMIDSFDPHEPWDPPHPYCEMYNPGYKGDRVIWPTYGWCNLTPDELKEVRALYAGKITMVDHWLGKLLDAVEELGLMETTAIILVTDHGHMLGEHGTIGKPWVPLSDSNLYQEVAHIPMMMYYPGCQGGKRVEHLVQLIDVFPTVLSAMGLPVPEDVHGRDLVPVLQGSETYATRDYAFYGRFGESINVTDGTWTLFLWPPGDKNEPLYWYSAIPPKFHEKAKGNVTQGPFPVDTPRGECKTVLFNIRQDYHQLNDVLEKEPETARRLAGEIRRFLIDIGAPCEQLIRLGLDRE